MRRKIWWGLGVVAVMAALGISLLVHTLSSASQMAIGYPGLASGESALLEGYRLAKGILLFREISGRVVQAKTTDSERVAALVAWTHENVRPNYAASGDLVQGNFYDIARRGFGYCDQVAHVFLTLAHYAGYEGRMLQLRREDGRSRHSLAEVRVGDRWILVDPWLGVVLHDDSGHPVTITDLERRPKLLAQAGYEASLSLRVNEFANATVLRTFPYQDFGAFVKKVLIKLRRLPIFPPLASILPEQGASAVSVRAIASNQAPINGGVLSWRASLYDAARRAHLNSRYTEAVGYYERILASDVEDGIANSTRFFLGLALLRAGQATEALRAFDRALSERSDTPWRNSILYYRSEAKESIGDVAGAMTDLQAADMPPARHRLRELRSNHYPRSLSE